MNALHILGLVLLGALALPFCLALGVVSLLAIGLGSLLVCMALGAIAAFWLLRRLHGALWQAALRVSGAVPRRGRA